MATAARKNSPLTGRNLGQNLALGGRPSAWTGWVDSERERERERDRQINRQTDREMHSNNSSSCDLIRIRVLIQVLNKNMTSNTK